MLWALLAGMQLRQQKIVRRIKMRRDSLNQFNQPAFLQFITQELEGNLVASQQTGTNHEKKRDERERKGGRESEWRAVDVQRATGL